jgi:chromosome segregation protein
MESTARRREALAATKLSTEAALEIAEAAPGQAEERRLALIDALSTAEARKAKASDALAAAETARSEADRAARAAEERASAAREARAGSEARLEAARERLAEHAQALAEAGGETTSPIGRGRDANEESDRVRGYAAGSETPATPPGSPSPLGGGEAPAFSPPSGGRAGEAGRGVNATAVASDNYPGEPGAAEARLAALERERDNLGPVNLRAEDEAAELAERVATLAAERADLAGALAKLRQGVGELNAEGRTRLLEAFEVIHGHFRDLFVTLFQGGQAELRLIESDDPLEAGLEILACPPGKRMAVMSLMSGGEQALTAMALIFAVFLANPAPVCVLDEADAPLDDANVERFCDLLAAMRTRASTRFIVISHNALTMSRMDRLYGVTMREPGVSQLVSVDLRQAEAMAANA